MANKSTKSPLSKVTTANPLDGHVNGVNRASAGDVNAAGPAKPGPQNDRDSVGDVYAVGPAKPGPQNDRDSVGDVYAVGLAKPGPQNDSDRKFKVANIQEHITSREMWAGSRSPEKIPNLYGMDESGKLTLLDQEHTPALLKCISEIFNNAIDHVFNKNSVPVTTINVSIVNGLITVYNDGNGIPVILHRAQSAKLKKDIYIPDLIFSEALCGSSDFDRANGAVFKASVNSLGAKICNYNSEYFSVETDDGIKYFKQEYDNKIAFNKNPPTITKSTGTQFTRITFMLKYDDFGLAAMKDRVFADLTKWLRYNVHINSVYVNECKHKVKFTFNGEPCTVTTADQLAAAMFGNATIIKGSVVGNVEPYNRYPWTIAMAIFDSDTAPKFGRVKIRPISMVNSVQTLEGNHVEFIKEAIADRFKQKWPMDVTTSAIMDNALFVLVAPIANADWDAQNKTKLTKPAMATIKQYYRINTKFIEDCVNLLIVPFQNALNKKAPKPAGMPTELAHAKYAGQKTKSQYCSMIIAEGVSATGIFRAGLGLNSANRATGAPNFDWVGFLALGGVILNVKREIEIVETAGKEIIISSQKIYENEKLNQVMDVLGLNYSKKYETQEELDTLKYGKIIIATDSDVDAAKISSLLLVFIYTFWPALIESGRVYYWKTPLIRMVNKKTGITTEFNTIEEYERAISTVDIKQHDVMYFKGLAGHAKEHIAQMFKPHVYESNMYRYTLDDGAREMLEAYFGKESDERKHILKVPMCESITELEEYNAVHKCTENKELPIGREQLGYSTKLYKLDALKRQIPHALDNLTESRRKVINVALTSDYLPSHTSNKQIKVDSFAAYVSTVMGYHHGVHSLELTIVYLAQGMQNYRTLPLLYGVGSFGNQHGAPAGSPRYIHVKKSPMLAELYHHLDDRILTPIIDEGQEVECRHMIPIIPVSIIESQHNVSEGWSCNIIGRDIDDVYAILRLYLSDKSHTDTLNLYQGKLINAIDAIDKTIVHYSTDISQYEEAKKQYQLVLDEIAVLPYKLEPNLRGFAGEYITIEGKQYTKGKYVETIGASQVKITITALPLNVVTNDYLNSITSDDTVDGKVTKNTKMQYISSFRNQSDAYNVKLEFMFKLDKYREMQAKYTDDSPRKMSPVERFFNLVKPLSSRLCYIAENGSVLEFESNYLAAMLYWMHYRRIFYEKRIRRGILILTHKIGMLESTDRYIRYFNQRENDLSKFIRDTKKLEQIMIEGKYKRYNATFLNNTGRTPIEELEHNILESGASFNYLLNLRISDFDTSKDTKRTDELKTLKSELTTLQACMTEYPIAKSKWLLEIEKLRKTIEQGITTAWTFKGDTVKHDETIISDIEDDDIIN